MKIFIIELEGDNFETIFANNKEDAEKQAFDMFALDYLEIWCSSRRE